MLTAVAITVILVAIGWAAYGASLPSRTSAVFILDVMVGAAVFCCVGFAVATFIHNADAAQPVALAIALPLTFISGIFIPLAELPHWLADIATVWEEAGVYRIRRPAGACHLFNQRKEMAADCSS